MHRTAVCAAFILQLSFSVYAANRGITAGSLARLNSKGELAGPCPLKHTDVKAEISGFMARVRVTQEFQNPYTEKIEAVYTFPLPASAAVDNMTMLVGDRTIRGKIKRSEEARALYDAARASGRTAGLLDQERPNIFTQSVANIPPGEKVQIEITYIETLEFASGEYTFAFPMVVGPRYIPGYPVGKQGGGWSPDTDRVPDASRITPPVTPPGTRAGHDISIEVALDAGVPIDRLESPTHDVAVNRRGARQATIQLKDRSVIPNKDFVLKYGGASSKIEDAVLAHADARGGFFTLILQPPARTAPEEVTPKELVFVLDTSGSMSGFPIEKAKETMKMAIAALNPRDTFNLITFAGDTHVLFPQPVPATPANIAQAQSFLAGRYGSGGTEMMHAIRIALEPSDAQNHVRVVCFMTDGYVGNDMEIVGEVQKHSNARVFAFGIGGAVNHFLLDNMAKYGRGEVEYVGLQDDGSAAARRFHERVQNPLLTDISIDWGGLPISQVYPERVPDVFSSKALVLAGRYRGPAGGVIRLRGKQAGRVVVREIAVNLPGGEAHNEALATVWARRRVDDLMSRDFTGMQYGTMRDDLRESITQLGLDYRLMTQFTSFVAVEETTVATEGGPPRRIEVPVEMPEGVSYRGVFGNEGREVEAMAIAQGAPMTPGFAGGALSRRAVMADVMQIRKDAPPRSKLHRALLAVAENRAQKTPEFVKNGKAGIIVTLDDASPSVLAALKALGFETEARPNNGKVLVGRIAVGKLKALAALDHVRYVMPQMSM